MNASPAVVPPTFADGTNGVQRVLLGQEEHLVTYLDAATLQGFGAEAREIGLNVVCGSLLPRPLLNLLEHHNGWSVRVYPALRRRGGTTPLVTRVVVARWRYTPRLEHRRWTVPADQLAHVERRLQAFALAPSVVIDARPDQAVALWALAQPLSLKTPEGLHDAQALQSALADALGASRAPFRNQFPRPTGAPEPPVVTDDAIEAPIPLCGAPRGFGDDVPRAVIRHVDETAIYTREQIEHAIQESSSK